MSFLKIGFSLLFGAALFAQNEVPTDGRSLSNWYTSDDTPDEGWQTANAKSASHGPSRATLDACPSKDDKAPGATVNPNFDKKHNGVTDALIGSKYLTVNVVNYSEEMLKHVLAPEGEPIKHLCPDDFGRIRIPKSYFTDKKGETLQLVARDAIGRKHWSQTFIVGKKSTSFIWAVGENDAQGPLSYWAQKWAVEGNLEGFNPELAARNIERAELGGVPSGVAVAEERGLGTYGAYGPGIYTGIVPQAPYLVQSPCAPNCTNAYVTGTTFVGGRVISGGPYGYNNPCLGYDPVKEYVNGYGTTYVQQPGGPIFAPAGWSSCGAGYRGGYRPVQRERVHVRWGVAVGGRY